MLIKKVLYGHFNDAETQASICYTNFCTVNKKQRDTDKYILERLNKAVKRHLVDKQIRMIVHYFIPDSTFAFSQ